MALGFSSETSLVVVVALTVVFLSNARLSSSARPPAPLPAGDDDGISYYTIVGVSAAACIVVLFVCFACIVAMERLFGRRRSILTVQVLVSDRAGDVGSVLLDIFRSNGVTESQTPILNETINALLKHQKSFIYGCSSVQVTYGKPYVKTILWGNMAKEKTKLGIQRRGLDNHQLVPMLAPKQNVKQHTLVTLMVAADGAHRLPSIENSEDVKEALNYLDTKLPNIEVAYVIWTYWDPLSLQSWLEICPDLKPIYA